MLPDLLFLSLGEGGRFLWGGCCLESVREKWAFHAVSIHLLSTYYALLHEAAGTPRKKAVRAQVPHRAHTLRGVRAGAIRDATGTSTGAFAGDLALRVQGEMTFQRERRKGSSPCEGSI